MIAPPTLMTANCCEETDVKCERYCWTSRLEPILLSSWTTVERVENCEWAGEVYCRRNVLWIVKAAIGRLLGLIERRWPCRRSPLVVEQLQNA